MMKLSRSRVLLLLLLILIIIAAHTILLPYSPSSQPSAFPTPINAGLQDPSSQYLTISSIVQEIATTINARVSTFDASSALELGIDLGPRSELTMTNYVNSLRNSHSMLFPSRVSRLLPASLKSSEPKTLWDPRQHGQSILDLAMNRLSLFPSFPPSEPLPKTVYTTDLRPPSEAPEQFASWANINQDWEVRFVDDLQMDEWFRLTFGDSVADELMSLQGVVRADLFRYLILFMKGGVYTDTDTACVRPISDWAPSPEVRHVSRIAAALPDLLRISQSDSSDPHSTQSHFFDGGDDGPGLIVALEIDAPVLKLNWREQNFVRGIQVAQWTILAKPGHPVLLDVVGHALKMAREATEAKNAGRGVGPDILNLSGPGAFTDAFLRFLLLRHGVYPHDLSGLQRPVRYGDVVILPEHSFRADASEGFQGDFKLVWHGFFGRWKEDSEEQKEEVNEA